MFLDRPAKAREIYLAHRGEKVPMHRTWEAAVDDFKAFRLAEMSKPLTDQIEKAFASPGGK